MRVLHVSGATSWGGNEQQLLYLVEELQKHQVTQLLFCFENTPLYHKTLQLPVAITAVKKSSPYSNLYRQTLRKIIQQENPDLIHLHTSDSVTGFMVADVLNGLKTPAIFAKKGIGSSMSYFSKIKYNYSNIKKILCVSNYVKENFRQYLKKKNRHKLIVVHDGVKIEDKEILTAFDLRDHLKISPDTFLIGNIANHTKAKSLHTLIEVVDVLVNKRMFKDFHVVQIGEKSKMTPQLKQQIEEKNLGSYITLLGFVENASHFLPQFDVFVMTSEREGGPSSIMEAFDFKTPVIATAVGVVPEVLKDGYNGFVVQVGDSEGIAEKIIRVKKNPLLREKFSERAYNIFIEKFTTEKLGQATLKVYREILNDDE